MKAPVICPYYAPAGSESEEKGCTTVGSICALYFGLILAGGILIITGIIACCVCCNRKTVVYQQIPPASSMYQQPSVYQNQYKL